MSQLEIPWSRRPATTGRPKGRPFIANTSNSNLLWHESSPDAALRRGEELARTRKSTTTVYEVLEDRSTSRLAAFNPEGKRFL